MAVAIVQICSERHFLKNGRDQEISVSLDQPLFVYKYGDSVRYKNQCLTDTIYSLENRIFSLKMPILIFFYSKNY